MFVQRRRYTREAERVSGEGRHWRRWRWPCGAVGGEAGARRVLSDSGSLKKQDAQDTRGETVQAKGGVVEQYFVFVLACGVRDS